MEVPIDRFAHGGVMTFQCYFVPFPINVYMVRFLLPKDIQQLLEDRVKTFNNMAQVPGLGLSYGDCQHLVLKVVGPKKLATSNFVNN